MFDGGGHSGRSLETRPPGADQFRGGRAQSDERDPDEHRGDAESQRQPHGPADQGLRSAEEEDQPERDFEPVVHRRMMLDPGR